MRAAARESPCLKPNSILLVAVLVLSKVLGES